MLANISRNKGNQTMIFGQSLDTKYGGETIPRPFWINCLKFHTVCFYCMPSCEDYQHILKLHCKPLAFTLYKVFLRKQKRGLELVSLPHFLHDF